MHISLPHLRLRLLAACALLCLVAFAVAGCSSREDSPEDRAAPPGLVSPEFPQALGQAQISAGEALTLVQAMPGLAAGLQESADEDSGYTWSEERRRWEWRLQGSAGGRSTGHFFEVQYLDGGGNPQKGVEGAARIAVAMTGDDNSHREQDGDVFDNKVKHEYRVEITGLGSPILTMTGAGGSDWDWSGQVDDVPHSSGYEVSWEILEPGITRPAAGGCPSGTIRTEMASYYLLAVFDGSDTGVATLYDAEGNIAPYGQRTQEIGCDAE
jgi:hypothetical protein